MSNSKLNTSKVARNEKRRSVGVGDEIRTIRRAREITLKALSAKAGCSAAYLSRIERGEAKISVDLLTAIGEALDVDPKWFFPSRSGEGNNERNYVVRANARRPLSRLYTRSTEELGFEDEMLSSSLAGDCYMMQTRFPPGQERQVSATEGYTYEGEQHGVVIQGQMELILDRESIILKTGDSFSYPTEIPHRLRNPTDEESVVIITMTPVRITW
jgi:transcriptional regulator with XRE-family HTH domain